MFRQPPPGPQPVWKRPLYLSLTTLLGVIVSYGLHAVAELAYLAWANNHDKSIVWRSHFGLGACALPDVVQYGLLIAGIIGGFLIGRIWWRWVYLERRWAKTPPPPPHA